ncbi:MAG: hypothetical protein HRF45_12490 [Fimbriimonadia bacterium]|jgi:tRNA G18 (ribose-2'-O)-methylase SpoU
MAKKRRVEETIEHQLEMWRASRNAPADPGLRDAYPDIPRLPIRLICPRLDKEINHGNLLRIAEAFRLEMVVFAPDDRPWDLSGAMGATVWQPFERKPGAEAIAQAKTDGYRIYGLDLHERARNLHSVEWRFPAALVVGEELHGLADEHRSACDELVAIPLYGLMQSLNVAVATGICLDRMVETLARQDPQWRPVRAASRRLLD